MEKEFIPYEQAVDLKELGYNRKCLGQFNTHQGDKWLFSIDLSGEGQYPSNSRACLAPTFSQAFRWFREKYNEHTILIPYCDSSGKVLSYRFEIVVQDYNLDDFESECKDYTYEEAELECLKKLIEIVKEQK